MKAKIVNNKIIIKPIPEKDIKLGLALYSKQFITEANKGTALADVKKGQEDYELPINFKKKKYRLYVNETNRTR